MLRQHLFKHFLFQRSNDRSIWVKHPIKQNKTSLKKSINSESHLHFNSASTYIGLSSSQCLFFLKSNGRREAMIFLLKQAFRADRLHRLLAFIADFNEASFPCLARETFESPNSQKTGSAVTMLTDSSARTNSTSSPCH